MLAKIIASVISAAILQSISSLSVPYLTIEMMKPYRAWQGVAADDSYIYVATDRDENFNLKNILSVYTKDGELVREKENAYTGRDPLNRFMSFGNITVINGYLFAPVYNWNGGAAGTPESRMSRVIKYSLPDLSIVGSYELGDGTAEGISLHNGHYWIVYHDLQVIREFDIEFNLVKIYPLSQSITFGGTEMGPQSIIWEDNTVYLNNHGANEYNMFYAIGVDRYDFNGSTFNFVERIKPPTYGAGQGMSKSGGKYYWIDRPANEVVITNVIKLYP